ncbi:Histone-lysine N-methyltransferase SETMAR [Eumeta japonica]|uniref:Histone-lysine N-methyltransferase SETMAR n=1 Tax=Eumeta variegata TaxID=151549 RepID=A0A4C1TS36_EUMVA|nr:Histone-lysine N-methyltransferase SETMAR [Eumeta japonica]
MTAKVTSQPVGDSDNIYSQLFYINHYTFIKKKNTGSTPGVPAENFNKNGNTGFCITLKELNFNIESGNFDGKDEPRSGRPVTDKVDAILEKAEQDRHISSYGIAQELDIDHRTILTQLEIAEYTEKFKTRVPHVLTEGNLMNRVLICDSLFKRNETEPFLKRLITEDEKWITYNKTFSPKDILMAFQHFCTCLSSRHRSSLISSLCDLPSKEQTPHFMYGLTGKTKQKKAASIRTEISSTGGGASKKLILSEQEQRLLSIIGKSVVMGRGPEIGFQNVGYSTCRTRSFESISTVPNPAPAIPAASRILSTRQIPKMKKMQSHQEQLDVTGDVVDDLRHFKWRPYSCRNRAERLDLEERRLEVDRLREENIAQNRQLQEKFYRCCEDMRVGRRWNGADRAVQWRPTSCSLSSL